MFSIKRLVSLAQDWTLGLLIAAIIVVIVMVLVNSLTSNKKFSPLSFIVCVALAGILSYQMSLMVGAISILNNAYDIANFVGVFSPEIADSIDALSEKELGWYIVRRILWSLLFIVLGCFGICMSMETGARNPRKHGKTGRRKYRTYDDNF